MPAALIGLAPITVRLPAVVRLLAAAAVFLLTDGRLLGHWFGTRILVLETMGRHSGQIRRTPLVYLRDDADLVVVAANGGAPRHPAWWLNLRGHVAGPPAVDPATINTHRVLHQRGPRLAEHRERTVSGGLQEVRVLRRTAIELVGTWSSVRRP